MLVKLNLHFPHSRLIDLKNIYDLSFLKNYEEKYKTNVFGYTKNWLRYNNAFFWR